MAEVWTVVMVGGSSCGHGEREERFRVREVQIIARRGERTETKGLRVFTDQWSLATTRLELRRAEGSDAAAIAAFWRDPIVRTFLGGEASFDEARRRVHARIAAGDLLAVRLAGDARIIGAISVVETGDGRRELAYLFAADKWGQGYATESICSLIRALRAKREGVRLFATTQTANLASRKLLARLGFSESRQFVEFSEMQVTFDLTL